MTDRDAQAWGRIAVSLPGWRVLRGIRWRGENGAPMGSEWQPWPDPDDPATAGCLLELLGTRCLVRILPREGRALCEIVIPGDLTLDGRPHRINGHDLGRACIAAAEALGRWPGAWAGTTLPPA